MENPKVGNYYSDNNISYRCEGSEIWVGELGYDTRPFIWDGKKNYGIPVGYSIGFANGYMSRHGEVVPRGNVRKHIGSLPLETEVIILLYSGMHRRGYYAFVKKEGGWLCTEIVWE